MSLLKHRRQTDITDEQIEKIVASRLGGKVLKIRQAKGGMANDVFFVEIEESRSGGLAAREVVLRVSPREGARCKGFEGERWALKQCRKNGIPVPKVLAFGTVQTGPHHLHQYLIIEKIKGRAIRWKSQEARLYLEEAGHLLARIHSIKTEGFGPLNSQGRGPFKSWEEFLLSSYKNEPLLDYLLWKRFISKDQKNRVLDLFDPKKLRLNVKLPTLLHGDFTYEHIFVDGGKITGIIDFGDCLSGDPLYDLAIPELFCEIGGLPSPIPHLSKGYQNGFSKEDLGRKLTLYKLHKALPLIWWWKEERKELRRFLAARRLAQLVKRYLEELR